MEMKEAIVEACRNNLITATEALADNEYDITDKNIKNLRFNSAVS